MSWLDKTIIICAAYAFCCGPAHASETGGAINENLINVVSVGYDIANNPKAQKMLKDMAQAARDSGAVGEVIMAGQDEEQLDRAMEQAIAIAVKPAAPVYSLELRTKTAAPGGEIAVVHSDFQIADKNAWIAFYRNPGDSDDNYISYTFLRNLTDRVYTVEAPEPGNEYHFRIFLTQGYEAAARSDPVQVIDH